MQCMFGLSFSMASFQSVSALFLSCCSSNVFFSKRFRRSHPPWALLIEFGVLCDMAFSNRVRRFPLFGRFQALSAILLSVAFAKRIRVVVLLFKVAFFPTELDVFFFNGLYRPNLASLSQWRLPTDFGIVCYWPFPTDFGAFFPNGPFPALFFVMAFKSASALS